MNQNVFLISTLTYIVFPKQVEFRRGIGVLCLLGKFIKSFLGEAPHEDAKNVQSSLGIWFSFLNPKQF